MIDMIHPAAILAALATLTTPGTPSATPSPKPNAAADTPALRLDQAIEPRRAFDDGLALLESGAEPALAAASFTLAAEAEDVPPALRALALHNAGLAMLRAGDTPEAQRFFSEAELAASAPDVQAASRFNTAAAWFAAAAKPDPAEPDPDEPDPAPKMSVAQRLDLLRRSERAYRAVLDIDPAHTEAARRVERVRRIIRAIEEEQRRLQEQAAQMQQQAEKLDELAQQQQAESDQNSDPQIDKQDAAKDQQSLSEQTEQQRQEAQQQGEQQQDQQAKTAQQAAEQLIQQAREHQDRAEAALEEGNTAAAAEAQQQAAESLRQAADALRQAAEDSQPKPSDEPKPSEDKNEDAEGEPKPSEDEQQQPDEAAGDPLAERLLDRERQQRDARQDLLRAIKGRPETVERDW